MQNRLFQESQRFNQWWLWLLLSACAIFVLVSAFFSSEPIGGIIGVIVIILVIALFLVLHLTSRVDEEGVQMRYYPFLKKTFRWDEIESVQLVNYGFVGYGIRYSFKYRRVYNVRGKMGLLVQPKNGKKFVIGTQKVEELRAVLTNLGRV